MVITELLDVPKPTFYLGYAVFAGWWLLASVAELRRTRWPVLAAALRALGASVVTDQLRPDTDVGLMVEDSFKFLGVLAWAQYHLLTAGDLIRSIVPTADGEGVRVAVGSGGGETP